jgi:hypothetical protein
VWLEKNIGNLDESLDLKQELPAISSEQLYVAINAERIQRGISWEQVAKEAGVKPSTLFWMQSRSPSVEGFIKCLGWFVLNCSKQQICDHSGAIMVGGIGTLLEPPNPKRICLKCGDEV